MVQKRIHDYRGPRSSKNLNGHLLGVVAPGVYQGFQVRSDGSVSPGMLITAEGIRIEETVDISVPQPLADPANPRIDLVVCQHEYEKTVPAPPAVFTTVPGTPAPDPLPPDIPEHATLIAACRMEAGAAEWNDILHLGYARRVYNAEQQPDHTWKIVLGSRGAMMQLFDPNSGTVAAFVVAPGTYADGETILLRPAGATKDRSTGALRCFSSTRTASSRSSPCRATWTRRSAIARPPTTPWTTPWTTPSSTRPAAPSPATSRSRAS